MIVGKHAVFLCDITGVMAEPWADAGYQCHCVDIQEGSHTHANIRRYVADIRFWMPPCEPYETAFICAFPPCTNLAVSGARWFQGKGLGGLISALELVERSRTVLEYFGQFGVPWFIENPVSTISTYWRKPDHTFDPCDYSGWCADDNYTKKTCLWTGGGFVMPPPFRNESLGPPDDRIHKCPPSAERANIRSATPRGFARAVFAANNGK